MERGREGGGTRQREGKGKREGRREKWKGRVPSRLEGRSLRASIAAESRCMYWDKSRRFKEYNPKLDSSPINSKYLIKQPRASMASFNSSSAGNSHFQPIKKNP